mgnify:FL=1
MISSPCKFNVVRVSPFLKTNEEVKAKETPSWNVTSEPVEQKAMSFDWDSNSNDSEEAITRVVLKDESETEMNLDVTDSKEVLSPEQQQKRTQERLSRIQEYTMKLKKADGIHEFENEPAYVRRNIQLDESTPSSEDQSSRFSVSNDENGTSLSGNNSFLHDNVD